MCLVYTYRSTFSDFAQKYGKDERFKNIEKMRERESMFNDFVQELRKLEREKRLSQREKVGMQAYTTSGSALEGSLSIYQACLSLKHSLLLYYLLATSFFTQMHNCTVNHFVAEFYLSLFSHYFQLEWINTLHNCPTHETEGPDFHS